MQNVPATRAASSSEEEPGTLQLPGGLRVKVFKTQLPGFHQLISAKRLNGPSLLQRETEREGRGEGGREGVGRLDALQLGKERTI